MEVHNAGRVQYLDGLRTTRPDADRWPSLVCTQLISLQLCRLTSFPSATEGRKGLERNIG